MNFERKYKIFNWGNFFMSAENQANTSNHSQNHRRIITLIEGALCVALSTVLTKLNLFSMPQGGSIDLELLPLILFAFRHGVKSGTGAGAVYGVVRIVTGAHIYYPVQAFLDYPLAFACAGVSGMKYKIPGLIIAALLQLLCHIVSGTVFFAEYAPAGESPFVYSLIYNAPIVILKYAISGAAAIFLCKALENALPANK